MASGLQELASLAGILGAVAIGTVSPGPSFVMVARIAVSASRAEGLAAAVGMGLGSVVFALVALLGLQAVLLAVPALYLGLKVLGGLYLAYLGVRIFAGARTPLPVEAAARGRRASARISFLRALTTQLSNPKTAIVFASVFAAFLPAAVSLDFAAAVLVGVFVLDAGWYALVALALSSAVPRRAYLSYKAWIDRTAGLVMICLGLKLISAVRA